MSDEKLYELTDLLIRIDEHLEASEGELTPEIEELLDSTEGKLLDKVESICRYRQELRMQADGAKAEKARLTQLSKVRRAKADSLDRYLKMMLERMGRDRIETVHFKVRIQQSPQSISWDGEPEEIPEAFRRTTHDVDGPAAKAYFKEHGKLPEGFVVSRGTHLRVT